MESQVDRSVWHALAGVTSIAPLLSSTVYYWPQGHVETYCGSAAVQALFAQFPEIKCGVLSMKFLADQATDEVFAHMILKPIPPGEVISQTSRSQITPSQIRSGCIKHLESYDLGRGSIKIQCFGVDTVFQQQYIDVSICDIHNRVWKFGHTYNKALKCHYLTDGWGEFVTTKKLLAGDALVFLKTIVGGVILGIRRAIPTSVSEGFYYKIKDRIQRNGKDLCSVEALGEALGKALRNIEFEVAYYPSACGSHFIHDSEEVEASRNVPWNLGMRVIKTSIEKDKLTRVCHHGIITSLSKNPLKCEEFSKFCDEKMSLIITTLNWTRPWSEQILQAFFVTAKCVWLLHLLAFSFKPAYLGILRVEENIVFESSYMEDMGADRDRQRSSSSSSSSRGPAQVKVMD